MIRLTPVLALVALAACEPAPNTGTGPDAPLNLAGTSWRVQSIAGVKVADPSQTSMTFDGSSVSGTFGCNRFNGPYSMSGNLLTVGPAATTRMACMGEAARHEQNGLRQLSMPLQVVRNGPDMLVLSGREGQSFVLSR